jgi:hypothetical protein
MVAHEAAERSEHGGQQHRQVFGPIHHYAEYYSLRVGRARFGWKSALEMQPNECHLIADSHMSHVNYTGLPALPHETVAFSIFREKTGKQFHMSSPITRSLRALVDPLLRTAPHAPLLYAMR